MLKWLCINKGSGCSGLKWCNHLDIPISIIPYLPLGDPSDIITRGGFGGTHILSFFREGSRFCKSSKEVVPDFDNRYKDKHIWWKSEDFHIPKWWFLNGPLSCVPLCCKTSHVKSLWGVFTWFKYNITHCVWYVSILQPIG